MTELIARLPIELANMCYSYMGKHPLAEIVKDYWDWKLNETEYIMCEDCNGEIEENGSYNYNGKCECCYIRANPQLDTRNGRFCDYCGDELRMYNWCKIYGNNGGEYCMDCYNHLEEEE